MSFWRKHVTRWIWRLRQHRTIRLRHLPEKPRPDFVTFSCNTQSIPAKKCHHQNSVFLGICSCRIMRYCLKAKGAPSKRISLQRERLYKMSWRAWCVDTKGVKFAVGLRRNRKRQVFQGIAALLKCCQILSRHTYISNGKMNLLFPYFPGFARCKRGVNCVRDGQKCLILQGKSAFVRGLPWQTNSIFIKCDQPPEKSRQW